MPIGRPRPYDPLRDKAIRKEQDRRRPITSPTSFLSDSARPDPTKNKRRVIFVRQADGTYVGQYSDGMAWQSFLATSVSYATPTITYGTTYNQGIGTKTIRSDSRLKFPAAVMSSANSSTLTLTDDATNQTLTGNLGNITIAMPVNAAGYGLNLAGQFAWGEATISSADMAQLSADSTTFPGLQNGAGIHVTLTRNAAGGSSGDRMEGFRLIVSDAGGPTYTNAETVGVESRFLSNALSGTHSFTNRAAYEARMDVVTGASVTVTNQYGLNVLAWHAVGGTAGTYTNAYGANILLPTLGNTIRRGVSINTNTFNFGTEATNVEGYYCEDITRGTTQRVSFYGEGHTTGTPARAITFEAPAHAVGTDRWSLRGGNKIENTATDVIASAQSMGFVGQYSDQAGRYFRLRALYNGGAPALTIDDVGTALPTT